MLTRARYLFQVLKHSVLGVDQRNEDVMQVDEIEVARSSRPKRKRADTATVTTAKKKKKSS